MKSSFCRSQVFLFVIIVLGDFVKYLSESYQGIILLKRLCKTETNAIIFLILVGKSHYELKGGLSLKKIINTYSSVLHSHKIHLK